MPKHTPGPWSRNIRPGTKYPAIFAGRNTHVAVAKTDLPETEVEANIDLIKAAPELLAALKVARAEIDAVIDVCANDVDTCKKLLHATKMCSWAINRAEGEA